MENKTGKYLKYAIGEILLVVIGILIALGVNQRSQKKANEAKIEAIFEVILKDLSADITECTQIIETIVHVDSVSYAILNDSVNQSSLQQNSNRSVYEKVDILTFTNLFNFTDGGYQSLAQNLDILPQKYNNIISDLNQQYHAVKESVEYWDDRVNQLTIKNEAFLVNNFQWIHNPSLWEANIDELLLHPKYKNLLAKFKEVNLGWLNHVWRYRTHCINNYQNIARLLNKPILEDSFKVEDNMADLFLGEWKNKSNPRQNIVFTKHNGRVYVQSKNNDELKNEVYLLAIKTKDSTNKILSVFERNITHHSFNEDTMIMRYYKWVDNGIEELIFSKVK